MSAIDVPFRAVHEESLRGEEPHGTGLTDSAAPAAPNVSSPDVGRISQAGDRGTYAAFLNEKPPIGMTA